MKVTQRNAWKIYFEITEENEKLCDERNERY